MEKCYQVEQKEINNEIERILIELTKENFKYKGRLRSCSAYVFESENYYILQSYFTAVAAIDKRTGILYDCLRKFWGYTATSAQHIRKFSQDYCAKSTLTWREV